MKIGHRATTYFMTSANDWRFKTYFSKQNEFIFVQFALQPRLFVAKISNLGMAFCFQNCSDLLWEKIVLVIDFFCKL